MKKFKLSEPFDKNQVEHFSHYDYILQVIENGQPTALKDHLTRIDSPSLVHLWDIMPALATYREIVKTEILKRMKGKI